ncbi:MAG: signal recognition particle-docking protein FtsY [Candidatus Micrarchaeota archaeon]
MFGLLKKKISSFVSSIVEKKEDIVREGDAGKEELEMPQAVEEPIPETPATPEPETEKQITRAEKPEQVQAPTELETIPEKPVGTKAEPTIEQIPETKEPIPDTQEEQLPQQGISEDEPKEPEPPELGGTEPAPQEEKQEHEKLSEIMEKKPERKEAPKKEKFPVNLSLGSKVRSFISRDVNIKEEDISGLTDSLNLSLLESDVAYDVAEQLVEDIREKLVGMHVPKNSLDTSVKGAVRDSLMEVLSVQGIDLMETINEKEKPVKILLLGPNGAGKTTTMAKLASKLMKNGYKCVFSASDTFRAAAIEQAEKHGEKLGVRVIKHKYGSDPTAVAFDAVNYARANSIEVVLIDSAGRQETNRNLIDEMKKLARVINPDLKIFVGESIAGNALVEQVKSFSEAIGLDGVILTKLDCDAKGGTAFSLARATGVPVLYFGVGQSYDDLVPFDPAYIVEQIMS